MEIGVLALAGSNDIRLLVAAGRAGELPLLDLSAPGSLTLERTDQLTSQITKFREALGSRFGLRLDSSTLPFLCSLSAPVELIVLAGRWSSLASVVASLRSQARRIFREVVGQDEADEAVAAGCDGVVAKGNESGGRVGSETTFVLLQRLCERVTVPVWAQGGIGPNSLAACQVAGACGVLLDAQLSLAEESSLPHPLRSLLAAMDGTETVCIGGQGGQCYRVHRLRGAGHLRALQELERNGASAAVLEQRLQEGLEDREDPLWPIGQEGALASRLALRHRNVAGILRAFRRQTTDNVRLARQTQALAERGPLAQAHGTRYSIVQGPMTRVSDTAAFADAVARGGALPFLALALMREGEVEKLLRETNALLGDQPWGVGILGFVPAELRQEQLRAVLQVRPRFALLAGGRPDQAQVLEAQGIATYIHAPSPRLVEMFLEQGTRRFVFEGRECGGHVGPLSSFMLWESVLEVIGQFQRRHPKGSPVDVLFAGGIHDGRSAAMVSALAGSAAAAAGLRIGVLMGTAYIFTNEAVQAGAVLPGFQDEALRCRDTVLLDMQGGHAIRCAPSPYVEEFEQQKQTLLRSGLSAEEMRPRLEEMNIGRLRIATKGLVRAAQPDQLREEMAASSPLVAVPLEKQQQEGMFMLGSVAALRERRCSIAELHAEVVQGCAARLAADLSAQPISDRSTAPIAIIGMAAAYPGGSTVAEFWRTILQKRLAIREVPPERWRADIFYDADPAAPDRVVSRWGGFIDPIPFDPLSYGIPPATLRSIEPTHLLLLEIAQRALCDAGYHQRPFPRERTAVIIGAGGGAADLGMAYQTRAMVRHYLSQVPGLSESAREETLAGLCRHLPSLTEDSFPGTLGNVAAGRVANRFDLGGPNFAVDAACASSLAALEAGVRELRSGGSDLVLLGALDGQQNISSYLMFSKTHALSPRGRCRPFDATADGIAISEGVALVVLKRLDDAQRDGDRIYAVLRSIGAASDGRDKSLTAPSRHGQRRALQQAYGALDFSPAAVGLVEAHGTGTVVGDQTELAVLQEMFEAAGARPQGAALGSVKSQIGHTKNAAGLAGLIKVALALHHRTLPPTLVDEPCVAARPRSLPLYLNTRARPWLHSIPAPRRGAVSAFGFGGTNFHAVLEESPEHAAALTERPAELFVLRAASRSALIQRLQWLQQVLKNDKPLRAIDLAALLHQDAARARGACRLAIVAADLAELQKQLEAALQALRGQASFSMSGPIAHAEEESAGEIAFLFPGQGSQYLNMLEDLALYFPTVREVWEQADCVLADAMPGSLTQVVYPPPAYTSAEEDEQRRALDQTQVTQPAMGAADFALYSLLEYLGIQPSTVGGHSYGEYVALCVGGVMSFADLLHLSEKRGRLVQETFGDQAVGMLAVNAPASQLTSLLQACPEVAIAAYNSPMQTVLGGGRAALDAIAPRLDAAGIGHQRLAVSAGFHIPEARPAAERFTEILRDLPLTQPRLPVYANRTAAAYPSEPSMIRQLLREHLTEPVRFQQQIEAMYEAGARTFLEVGPGQVLSGLVRQTLAARPGALILTTNRRNSGRAVADFLEVVGRLFVRGVPLRWERLFTGCELQVLDPDELSQPKPAPAPTTWLVDGGQARPLVEKPAASPPPPPLVSPKTLATTNGESLTKPLPIPAPPVTQVPMQPSIPTSLTPPRLDTSTAGEAMQAFQQTMASFLEYQTRYQEQRHALMNRFLQTQEAVLQAFLGRPTPIEGMTPAPLVVPPTQAKPPGFSNGVAPSPQIEPERAPTTPTNGHVEAKKTVEEPKTPPPVAAPASPEERRAQLHQMIIDLVSERTGYPPEMLQLDHNMEADLGIDSIKRTEIFGAIRNRLGLQGEAYEKEEYYIKLAKLRTLGEVLQWISEDPGTTPASPSPLEGQRVESHLFSLTNDMPSYLKQRSEQAALSSSKAESGWEEAVSARELVSATNGHASEKTTPPQAKRYLVQAAPASRNSDGQRQLRPREVVLVTEYASGLIHGVNPILGKTDHQAVFVRHAPTMRQVAPGTYEVDLLSQAAVEHLRSWIETCHGSVTSLLHLLPLGPPPEVDPAVCLEVRSLFLLAGTFAADLVKANGTIICATCMGGAFCLGGGALPFRPGAAAVSGLLKSLAREWPEVFIKSIDLSSQADDPYLVTQFLEEVASVDRTVEVGFSADSRTVLRPIETPLQRDRTPALQLDRQSVILVTGGARGITAAICTELARRFGSRLIIVGRSPLPDPEPSETRNLTSASDLKRALADRRKRRGEQLTPLAIEAEHRAILRNRELDANLERLRSLGATVEYHALDVRDDTAFTALVGSIYERYGRIDGVIHGAGILGDGLLAGKSSENFDRIFDTKVRPALTLTRILRPESLRFLAFFSSVAARFGNAGQTDYAAANEVLNKLAWQLDRDWPARVMAIGWGPWDEVGMANPERMSREYLASIGFTHMAVEDGCAGFVDELLYGRKGEAEVLIFAPLEAGPGASSTPIRDQVFA